MSLQARSGVALGRARTGSAQAALSFSDWLLLATARPSLWHFPGPGNSNICQIIYFYFLGQGARSWRGKVRRRDQLWRLRLLQSRAPDHKRCRPHLTKKLSNTPKSSKGTGNRSLLNVLLSMFFFSWTYAKIGYLKGWRVSQNAKTWGTSCWPTTD